MMNNLMRLSGIIALINISTCLSAQYPGAFDKPDSTHYSQRSISLNFRPSPDLARYSSGFKILKSVNDDLPNVEFNYLVQILLDDASFYDRQLLKRFAYVYNDAWFSKAAEKDVFYGVWREKLTGSLSEEEIRTTVTEGTNALLLLGYTDLGNDFLPFITGLMEEHHLVNYDNNRTKIFSPGSKGVVSSVQMLNALHSMETLNNFGVCRDVHETGRELLSTMASVYFDHFSPERKIDPDDYIFLQSWTTNKSQHVTVSFIDPVNEGRVYELDWGRVIQKDNISGYNNGRLYGNTYRIWQYDYRKKRTIPVDNRRTEFGRILDENILSPEEYTHFNGTYDQEYYSDIHYQGIGGKNSKLSLSSGYYYPEQHYFLATYFLDLKKKKILPFLYHTGTFGIQAALHEDTRKKQLLYPQKEWELAAGIMSVPRFISRFETNSFRLAPDLTAGAYFKQQFDAFFIAGLFHFGQDSGKHDLSTSGDGNINFSNGITLKYGHKSFYSSLSIQCRSFLMANDIRLFTPNPSTLFPNLRIVTPAYDIITSSSLRLNDRSIVAFNTVTEFTNKKTVIFSCTASTGYNISDSFGVSVRAGGIFKSGEIDFFWYPSSRKYAGIQLNYLKNSASVSLLKASGSRIIPNIAFRRSL
jgi:hypothetical protein